MDSITTAEMAEESQKNSWGTWLLSPIAKKAEVSDEERARKDRGKQERRIERGMKERRIGWKKAGLKREESLLRHEEEKINAADLADDGMIREIQDRVKAQEIYERYERERVEKERLARRQQQEHREKQERKAAEQKRQEERERWWQTFSDDVFRKRNEREAQADFTGSFSAAEGGSPRTPTSTCGHNGWWPKVQGLSDCSTCYETWNYLLQCPACQMKACPRCQGDIRPRRRYANTARANRRTPPTYDEYDDGNYRYSS